MQRRSSINLYLGMPLTVWPNTKLHNRQAKAHEATQRATGRELKAEQLLELAPDWETVSVLIT